MKQLLSTELSSIGHVVLDSRIRTELKNIPKSVYFDHSIINEYKSQKKIRELVHPQDHVLFFSNRPPLIKFPCKVSVFHQNAILLNKVSYLDIKSKVNQLWFKIFKKNANQFVVQNQSMRRMLSKHGCHNTTVINAAFFDMEKFNTKEKGNGFIYISSFAPHKNHKNLIKAWEYLIYHGLRNQLTLVSSGVADGLDEIISQSPAAKYITHLNGLSRDQVIEQYQKHEALIFPSKLESLGLPLLEAEAMGLPILASEKDYVRDIIVPDQSFDPSSYISIARSVMRFKDHNYNKSRLLSSQEFINKLLEKTKVSAPKAS